MSYARNAYAIIIIIGHGNNDRAAPFGRRIKLMMIIVVITILIMSLILL